jgi:hypothetical protein
MVEPVFFSRERCLRKLSGDWLCIGSQAQLAPIDGAIPPQQFYREAPRL